MQWKRAGYPSTKKFKLSPSAARVMLVAFFGFALKIILAHFMTKFQTVAIRYYSEVMLKKQKKQKK